MNPTPTPGDMPRRATLTPQPPAAPAAPGQRPAPTAADAITPGRLTGRERMVTLYPAGICLSRMTPHTRLVALTLLGYAHTRSGLLTRRLPTPRHLALDTGLDQAQVEVHLQTLTQRGWLRKHTVATGPRTGQQVPCLTIPQVYLTQIRKSRASTSGQGSAPFTTEGEPT
ncbi:hypothetical protein [Streptomyces sp. SHP 1-2]|uniref:hypothetical protein n=1 Tax=Streptomyces sp. SHP 1-2 TaxID=2769489 RepID=UPI00223858E5|nr:hypothetical protein [Streptomyces sp. SHP 1-2]MCW5252235.1 hypothetical protein [Streptomyces sp. SHP 1-2]